MKRCNKLVELGRRNFLSGAAAAAAAVPVAAVMSEKAKAAAGPARVDYPSNRLANVADLKADETVAVTYPDADAPGVLLKLGKKVPGGVGPDGDIVGFTTICPHKGYPARLQFGRQDIQLPRSLFPLRRRSRRPADLGSGDPEPSAIHAAGRRQGRHLCRRRG